MAEVKLTDAQRKTAKAAFDNFDKRNEEKIPVGQLSACMKAVGHSISPEWLEKIEDYIDQEGTGYVDFDEFCEIVRRKMQDTEDEKELRDIFRVLDKEKTGEVPTTELRWILKSLGNDLTEEDVDDMIADVDTDGSGFVDFNEFSKLMLSE